MPAITLSAPFHHRLDRLRRALQESCEGFWSVGFGLAGRVQPSDVELDDVMGDRRVLVVAPHPDDEVAGCGGAILEHRRRGDAVSVAFATDGRRSRALGLPPERMAAVRRSEAGEAAGILGVDLRWLGLPEGAWKTETLVRQLGELLVHLRPHLVYAPSRVDFHAEHERVARALARVLNDSSGASSPDPVLRVYAVQVPLTCELTNLVVPVDTSDAVLLAAFRAYRSQLGSLERCLRRRCYAGHRHGLPRGAEELWQLSAEVYARLHRLPPSRPLRRTFRSLRYYAWSDPLAYLKGRRERRRLARQAGGRRPVGEGGTG